MSQALPIASMMEPRTAAPQPRAHHRFIPKLGLYDLLMVLFVAVMVAQEPLQSLSWAINGLGVAFCLLSIIYMGRRKGRLQRELVMFALFVVWAALSSLATLADPARMMFELRLLIKEAILFFALTEYVIDRKSPTLIFLMLMLIPAVYWFYSRQTGELSTSTIGAASRLQSFSENPNSIGYACTYGLIGVTYLLWNPNRERLTLWPLLAIPPMATVLLLSASRKNILAFVVLFLAWAALAYGSVGRWRTWRRVFMSLLVIGLTAQAARSILPSLPVAGRFRKSIGNPVIDDSRYALYTDALRAFAQSPIFGQGLGARFTGGQVAHSDYAGALAETGLIGFVLYSSLYWILLRRLQRLRTKGKTATIRYLAGTYQAAILTLLFLGLGFANMYLVWSIYVIAVITGHTYVLERSSGLSRPPAPTTSG